jgi:hypothetical protein
MHVTSRSYLTAGIAALGAGAIAISPIQPIPNQMAVAPNRAVETIAVELAGTINPIKPVIDTIKASLANTGNLFRDWSAGLYVDGTIPTPANTTLNGNLGNRTGGYASGDPFPILQQWIANQISYLRQLPDIGGIIQQVIGNARNAIRAPFTVGEVKPGTVLGIPGQYNQNVSGVPFLTLPGAPINPRTVGALLPVLAPAEYATLKPILDFATTPISGLLIGAIGPVLAPVLAAVDSVQEAFAALRAREFADAINALINIPTSMINAGLNGGPTLDLTRILGGLLPASIKTIGITMGGLLSPGGVAFDALAAEADATIPGVGTITLDVPGYPVGPIGALTSLTNYVAKSIKPPTAGAGATAPRQVKAAAAAEVAAPASVAEVTAPASVAEVTAPAIAEVEAADDTPAPKRKSRAATRADKDTGKGSARADRGERRAG